MKLLNKKKSLILFILLTHNNILCTIADLKGKTLMWVTAGSKKVKGVKKVTTTTIFTMIKTLYHYGKNRGFLSLHVKIKGVNKNKNVFIKYLKTIGFNILSIQEELALSHSGCKKSRTRKI